MTVTQTAAITFTSGAVEARRSRRVAAAPSSVTADGFGGRDDHRDAEGRSVNPVSGKTVTLAKGGGSSTITTVSGVTNGSGDATFTVKDTVAEATTYTATDTTDSVTVTQSGDGHLHGRARRAPLLSRRELPPPRR